MYYVLFTYVIIKLVLIFHKLSSNLILCGECQAQFYLNDTEVRDECSKYCTNILTTCTVVSVSLIMSCEK